MQPYIHTYIQADGQAHRDTGDTYIQAGIHTGIHTYWPYIHT